MSTPDLARIAAWDIGRLRGAGRSLTAVADQFPSWRMRLESAGRELAAAACWSGPAATEATQAVVRLATAAHAVSRAFDTSLDGIDRLVSRSAEACHLAEEALALAAAAEISLGGDGRPTVPVPRPAPGMAADQVAVLHARATMSGQAVATAERALRAAAVAATAALEADEALHVVGVVDAFAPADFADLATVLRLDGRMAAPLVPTGRPPGDVAAWWAALSAAAQLAAIAAHPEQLGGLDGLPAWVRDRANRTVLARMLEAPGAPGQETAAVVAGMLAAEASAGRRAQLYQFAPTLGLVAVALGDVDTAGAVAVLVPGILTTVSDDLGHVLADARRVVAAAGAASPGLAVAAVAWLGYPSPQLLPEIVRRTNARIGGRLLDDALDGMAAARGALGQDRPRTTVLAHSYGTVVVDEAADRPGRLAADAVVLLGSPGMERGGARGLEAPEVYDAAAPADPVPWPRWFGEGPSERSYGATELPTGRGEGHSGYYDPRFPTLAALGRVVVGTFRPG